MALAPGVTLLLPVLSWLPGVPSAHLLPLCLQLLLPLPATCLLQVNKISDWGQRRGGRGLGVLSSMALNVAGRTLS